MKIQNCSLLLVLALTACNSASPIQNVDTKASSNSAENTQEENSSVQQVQNSVSASPVPFNQALDRTFSSEKLGISFRYPSMAMVGDCKDPISVTAQEGEYLVEFILSQMPDATCASLPNNIFNIIYVQRATNKTDIRQFIDRAFSPKCVIAEESEYEDNGNSFTRVFLQSENPPKDEPDLACSESILWDRTVGVVMFSPLGSKTGGGIDWPSSKEILMPDGSIEYAFDYPIMQSIRFLKP